MSDGGITFHDEDSGGLLLLATDPKFGPIVRLSLIGARWYHWLWWGDVFVGPVPILKPLFTLLIAILVGVWVR